MKFKYQYENLLKNKKSKKDLALRNHSEAKGALEAEKRKEEEFFRKVKASREFGESLVRNPEVDFQQMELLRWNEDFLQRQKIKIQRQSEVILSNQKVADQKQLELSDAAKQYKIFERLKVKLNDKFKGQQKKAELKAVDEMVVMRAARNKHLEEK